MLRMKLLKGNDLKTNTQMTKHNTKSQYFSLLQGKLWIIFLAEALTKSCLHLILSIQEALNIDLSQFYTKKFKHAVFQ